MNRRQILGVLAGGLALTLSRAIRAQQAPGNPILTEEERARFHEEMRSAETEEERERIRAEHQDLIRERARELGMDPPEDPLGHEYGPGPGPGMPAPAQGTPLPGMGTMGRGRGAGGATRGRGGGRRY